MRRGRTQYVVATLVFTLLIALTIGFSLLPWIGEYHLRAWEKYQTVGDRARMDGLLEKSESYYRAALIEAQKIGDRKRVGITSQYLASLRSLNEPGQNAGSVTQRADREFLVWGSPLDYLVGGKQKRRHKNLEMAMRPLLEREHATAIDSPERLIDLGDSQMQMFKYDNAKELYRQAGDANANKNAPFVEVKIIDRLAQVEFAEQHYKVAQEYVDQALQVLRLAPSRDMEILLRLHKAQTLAESGHVPEAKAICRQIMESSVVQEKPPYKWYVDVILGQCVSTSGHHQRALQLLQACTLSAPKLFGELSRNTARSYETLGEALIQAGRQDEAYACYQKVFQIRDQQDTSGKETKAKLFVYESFRYTSLKRHNIAIALCELALKKRQEQFGVNHRKTTSLVGHLKTAVEGAKDFTRAKQLQRRIEQLLSTGETDAGGK